MIDQFCQAICVPNTSQKILSLAYPPELNGLVEFFYEFMYFQKCLFRLDSQNQCQLIAWTDFFHFFLSHQEVLLNQFIHFSSRPIISILLDPETCPFYFNHPSFSNQLFSSVQMHQKSFLKSISMFLLRIFFYQ